MYFILEAVLISGVAFVRYRAALVLFVFLLALSPRSTSVAIGSAGLAFSFTRYALLLILGLLVAKLMMRPGLWRRAKQVLFRERATVILVVLVNLKLASSLHATGARSLPYIFDDLSITLLCFFIFFVFTKTYSDFRKILVAISVSVLLSGLLSMIEFPLAKPLVTFIASGAVAGSDDVLTGIMRDSSYRLQALFDNPLLLAEFTVLATPLVLYLFYTTTGISRIAFGGDGACGGGAFAGNRVACRLDAISSRDPGDLRSFKTWKLRVLVEIPCVFIAAYRRWRGPLFRF